MYLDKILTVLDERLAGNAEAMTWTSRRQTVKDLERPPKELGFFLVIQSEVLS